MRETFIRKNTHKSSSRALRYEDEVFQIGDGGIGSLSQKLYDTVTGIQLGKVEDTFGWTVEVK